jgi:hypothetical protein
MNDKDKQLEEMLDATLAEYSNVEPRAGLEQRILANLSAAPVEQERFAFLRFWPQWAISCAILFGILAFSVWRTKPAPQQIVKETPKITVSGPTPVIAAQQAPIMPVHVRRSHVRVQQVNASQQVANVKQPVFPAPSPLSDQERLLFAYMRRTPANEIAANAKPDDEPTLNKQLNEVLPMQKNVNNNTNTK